MIAAVSLRVEFLIRLLEIPQFTETLLAEGRGLPLTGIDYVRENLLAETLDVLNPSVV